VAEDGVDLGAGYAGEPFEEVVDAGAVFEVGEESLHGDSRAAENPGAADGFGVSLDGWAGAPIKHAERLTHPTTIFTPERFAKTAASESLSGV
jgi:hypothetical protein